MYCSSYCTANSYKMELLAQHLSSKNFRLKFFEDALYVQTYDDSNLNIIIFSFGCIIIWGEEKNTEYLILKEIKELVSDFVDFSYHDSVGNHNEDSNTFIEEERNRIVLGSKSEYLKLSISYALAQSVKLSLLESSVNKILKNTTHIQRELAQTGSVSLSKKEISKKIGHLFSERFSINLHRDILDTPEFFWKRPSYEPLYLMTAEFQDISVRQGILNWRLDIIQELYGILSNELNNKYSSRLEVTIIVLIAIEVLLSLSHNDIISKLLYLL